MTDNTRTDDKPGLGAQLWGAVRGALVEEDPVAATRRAKLQGGRAPLDTPEPAPASAAAAAPMSAMAATLLAQVLARPTAYTALTEKLEPLEGIVLDERTRYQAAYALIRSSRSVDQLLQAIAMQHLPALEAEAARFGAQLADKERQELAGVQRQFDAAARSVAQALDAAKATVLRYLA